MVDGLLVDGQRWRKDPCTNGEGSMQFGGTAGVNIVLLLILLICPVLGFAQQPPCAVGMLIEGIVTDPTGALIPGARVETASGATASTDASGQYVLACVPATSTTITVKADGFAEGTATARGHARGVVRVNVRLAVASVEADVQVSAEASGVDSDRNASTTTLETDQVRQLSDDPDDFLRELQSLAASGGGPPENAILVVNGFQNNSALPPKDSIASVQVNPDLFSSEYESAPWQGGRIVITTKPGTGPFHGSLFLSIVMEVLTRQTHFLLRLHPRGSGAMDLS